MNSHAYSYMLGQFELAQGEIETDLYPSCQTSLSAVHQMFDMHCALTFETRERETRDEMYERWGIK